MVQRKQRSQPESPEPNPFSNLSPQQQSLQRRRDREMDPECLPVDSMVRLMQSDGVYFVMSTYRKHAFGAGKTPREAIIDWRHGLALQDDKELTEEIAGYRAAARKYGANCGLIPPTPEPAKKPWYAKLLFWRK